MTTSTYRKNNTGRTRPWAGLCLSLFVTLAPCLLFAKTADYAAVGNIINYNLGTWTGIGSLAQDKNFCASSANDDNQNPGPSGAVMPYQAKVESSQGAGGDFYLYLGGDSSLTGNQRIRVSFLHKDQISGNTFEQLVYGSWDTHAHNGGFRNCPGGDNSVLRLEVSASDMAGKVSGTYRGDFVFGIIGGSSGSATASNSFRVSLSVQSSPEVQVSSLNDLALGSHAGLGNIYAEENFCVYSTSASGSYSLTVSSNNQDGSGNFYLSGGPGQIPYDLFFTDSASGPGTVKVSNASLSGFGDSADQFCSGADNATLSVSISEQALQQASSGSYSDSLVILVSPQ